MKEMMEKLLAAKEKEESEAGDEDGNKKESGDDVEKKDEPEVSQEKKEPDATEEKKEPDATEEKKEEPNAIEDDSTSPQQLPKDKVSESASDDSRVDLFEQMQIDHKADQIQHQVSETLQNSMA